MRPGNRAWQTGSRRNTQRGFTLIELLIAISLMALMAVLTWRGMDGMVNAQSSLKARSDAVLSLQAGLNQWGADLDAVVTLPPHTALDWDGRALRLTRRITGQNAIQNASRIANQSAVQTEDAVVVAWARRDVAGQGQWLRWQSAPVQSRGDLQNAWAAAGQWAQNPGDDLKTREVQIVPLAQWQIFYFRGDAWTNPLSAADGASPAQNAGAGLARAVESGVGGGGAGASNQGAASVLASIANNVNAQNGTAALPGSASWVGTPDGIRLVLTLPPGQPMVGKLTRDWIRPTLGGGKS